MPPKPQDDYSSVNSVAPETGSGNDTLSVRADPGAFGAQTSGALEQTGQMGQNLAEQYGKMATEAATNDVIANQFAPAAAKLKAQFYQLKGKDAVIGQDDYAQQLQQLRTQFLDNASGPYQREILSHYMSQHVAQEVDGAMRYADDQQTRYEDQSHNAMLSTLADNAVAFYNDPKIVAQSRNQMDNLILKHGMDRGLHPDDPQGAAIIGEQQRTMWGNTVKEIVSRAVSNGDIDIAQRSYNENRDSIPGHDQLEIDKMLHAETMRQYGQQAAKALMEGDPAPQGYGGQTAQAARGAVADAAKGAGIDVNHALTVLRIESADGTNVGARGDIGQTGKGGDLPEQARNMMEALAEAKTTADQALGRASMPWEQYVAYQQGSGGAPALFKAAQSDPTTRAVDALAPLYKTRGEALAAVANNGGNATMTAGQFLDAIHQKYDAESQRAAIALPAGANDAPQGQTVLTQTMTVPLSYDIDKVHQTPGIAVQQGATPMQSLVEFDKNYPDMLNRVNGIANLDKRQATLVALEQQHKIYQDAANAWKTQTLNEAQKLAADPKFTDVGMIPPQMAAALADSPSTMQYLQHSADYNSERSSGVTTTKESREYGSGFYDLFKRVHADSGAPDRITSADQLYSHIGPQGDLTIAGLHSLTKEIEGKNTPEGDAESMMKKQFFANAKTQISGTNEGFGFKDPKGDEIYLKFLASALPQIEKLKADGKSPSQIFNPDSPDYVGKLIPAFKRPMSQWMGDKMQDAGSAPPGARDLKSILSDVSSQKITSDQGKAEALKLGLIRDVPAVPHPE
jgi:hypothetical protein